MNQLTASQESQFNQLSRLQRNVCIGVIGGLSTIKAYKEAGGSAKNDSTASDVVSRMLTNVNVKAFIDSVLHWRVSSTIMEREEALMRLSVIARSTLSDIYEWTE